MASLQIYPLLGRRGGHWLGFAGAVVIASAGAAPLPFHDSFDYPPGNLYTVAAGVWSAGGNAGAELTVSNAAALTAPAGLTNASGKGVRWNPSGTARRSLVQFLAASNGVLYASFLLNVVNPPGAGSRLVAYFDSSTSQPASPQLGFFVGNGTVGIGKKASTPATTVVTGAGTHFIVLRDTFTGTAADQADLWVNPPSGSFGAASAPPAGATTSGGNNAASIPYFGIYAASGAGPTLYVDEVRLGTNWADVTPPDGSVPPLSTVSAPYITETALTGAGVILRGTNGPPLAGYEILSAPAATEPLAQWSLVGSNLFDAAGGFAYTNPLGPDPRRFFRLRTNSVTNSAPLSPPGITSQPQPQPAVLGGSALFSVTATGSAPLSYQWYFNTNTLLPGATTASLLLTNIQPDQAGVYSVTVTNAAGATNSDFAVLNIAPPPTNGDYFVSPTGNDANPGTIDLPFATVTKAVSLANPGNLIYVRGGTYLPTQTIVVNRSGTPGNLIKLWAYPGEQPVLDFVNQPYGSANRGFLFTTSGNYWHVKGLEIVRAGDNAIKVESSHCTFELLTLHHNGDSGLQIGFAHETSNPGANLAAFITVLNCDSYLNYDSDNRGSDADGFAAKLHCGQGIVFMGCRAWGNSDDGWDLFETDASVVISNCWTWHNGDAALYNVVGGSFQGNGNGFKLGGNGTGGSSEGVHYVYRCVSFNNNFPGRTRHGFDQNSHKGGNVVQHCVAWNNLYNYFFEDGAGSNPLEFKNNISFAGGQGNGVAQFPAGVVEQNNSWNLPVSASAADFTDLTEAAAAAPRNPDGSLPSGFARLVAGSDLVDRGGNLGQPFTGSAPDLGPFEQGD